MAAVRSAGGGQQQQRVCFKCGKPGHWARDCSAPQSEWVAKTPGPAGAGLTPSITPQTDQLPTPGLSPLPEVPVVGQKRKTRKKPKLTVELLMEQRGIQEVFNNFPTKARRAFKGRGHEAGDLGRLLQMYATWQRSLFPHTDFDSFLLELEKIGATHTMKVQMHELRQNFLKLMEPPREEEPGEEGQAEPGDGGGWPDEILGGGDHDDDDAMDHGAGDLQPQDQELDDEELMMMQYDDMDAQMDAAPEDMLACPPRAPAPPGGGPAGPQTGPGAAERDEGENSENEDDEELLALAFASQEPDNARSGPAAGRQADEDNENDMDDAELMALAFTQEEPSSSQQQPSASKTAADAGTQAGPAPEQPADEHSEPGQERALSLGHAGSPPQQDAQGAEANEDEELLALAFAEVT